MILQIHYEYGMIIMDFTSLMKSYIDRLIFPEQNCLLCEKVIYRTNMVKKKQYRRITNICQGCKEQLEPSVAPYCYYCHKPMYQSMQLQESSQLEDGGKLICEDCKEHIDSEIYNRSAVLYNDFMKEKIALYKYRGKESLSNVFSQMLVIAYEEYFQKMDINMLTFVPLHSIRLKERGFNQSEQLARKLSYYIGIPINDTLERVKYTEKQSKQNKKERLQHIRDSFEVKESSLPSISNKNMLIIDDIYTTGATINECSRILKKAGANKVYSLTLARAFH